MPVVLLACQFMSSELLHTFNAFNLQLTLLYSVDCFHVEVGHNWGSYHDLDTAECNPPFVEEGGRGKYVMYPSVLTGIEPNNKVRTMEEFH